MDSDDDKDLSLHKLTLRHQASIVSQLVDIGSERNKQQHIKLRSFIRSLQCLQPQGIRLRRTSVNAFRQQQYVALSYTWEPSEYEINLEVGRYLVEAWDDNRFTPSEVRNCVFERALSYMCHANVRLLWIDAHCVRQGTCDVDCRHIRCTQNRNALQAMDLVYQLSKHPVALLSRPLQNESELCLLRRILSGDLVDDDPEFQLSRSTTIPDARKALQLLREITQENWWGRAWTFQENYRGGRRMQLLIRHNPSLEGQKLRYRIFRAIPGELCVQSATFATETTRLCLALRKMTGELQPKDICWIDDVLRAAGRYATMLHGSSAMTPTVVADIEGRGLSKPWDRLPIIANCCQFSVRLDSGVLRRQHRSLSLSVLAMCLLNGEILDNNVDGWKPVAQLTTSRFLKEQLFGKFGAPKDDARPLTFNKGCRLTDVELTANGILTKGHLWKLGRVVDTSTFRPKLPRIDNPNGRLTLNERKRLLQLVFRLCDIGYRSLAGRIDKYLVADADSGGGPYASFTEEYLFRMASELAAAIRMHRKLRLGSIWDPTGRSAPYRAVFVWSNKNGNEDEDEARPPAFVFTSAWYRNPGSEAHDANDINRHVSLKVVVEEPVADRLPRLRIHSWLLGMCFFDGCRRTEVVFPWPQALH